jgi:hypothetical protein
MLNAASPPVCLTLALTPHGHLRLVHDAEASALPSDLPGRLQQAFSKGEGHGLLHLGAREVATALPTRFAWWRDFAARYITKVCASAEAESVHVAMPDLPALEKLIANAPPMLGAEYLSVAVLRAQWTLMDTALRAELADTALPLQAYLSARHSAWNLVGRVHFNLAENRKDAEAPFAFLATYTPRLSALGRAQHLPLSKALLEFSDSADRGQLLSLLMPVQRAAASCDWLADMVANNEIYHPLRWTAADAWRLLCDLPKLEAAGISVRTPGTWPSGRPARPKVKASVGAAQPSLLGMDALLDFQMALTLDGEPLSEDEIRALMRGTDGLQMMRGRWVELDRKKLESLMASFQAIERKAAESGLPFAEAMRLMAELSADAPGHDDAGLWSELTAGPWLAETLRGLRAPEGLAQVDPAPELKATLRPYQQHGVRWLYLLTRLGLGACLADDMGLGKTIQVLSLLLVLKRESASEHRPSVLVAPASLLANWAAEAARFAPSLRVLTAHPSVTPVAQLRALDGASFADVDLVLVSYGTLLRLPKFNDVSWRLAVLDEAQAIKNSGTKQTREVKKLQAQSRIALTGTPIENRLSDLWSIFDFTHPGLLGTEKVFAAYGKRLAEQQHFGALRTLVQPYILRRLKTDKRVISDLPDKSEVKAWCHLSAAQAVLYETTVTELSRALSDVEGITRKGLVLSFLMRFKQICNHPSQWLGDDAWLAADSGKFARLRELAEVIAAKQEKLLLFTQFRETTEPLAAFLGGIFGRDGVVLHGGVAVAKRRELVRRFQEDESVPFFVLSLKAGGAGLNLTAASHVIHFDRWWNPAVENQATDRAFRIGQKRNVLVHKFVCRGTVEERIDAMIESKLQLVTDVLEGGAEFNLTELSDRELLDLVKLDIHAAQEG